LNFQHFGNSVRRSGYPKNLSGYSVRGFGYPQKPSGNFKNHVRTSENAERTPFVWFPLSNAVGRWMC
jgi:hypothetical protein